MAPVKISYVVSFSSQDPRYPVENLLREDGAGPWLSCPRDRSRQLSAELQLERASAIGYVDVGNCGCALLQLEVGRSSWPRDRPYQPLLPCLALMAPADAKLDRNRCGVRMFKEEDFPAPAVGQRWDRLRVTCSQPFRRHGQFGLAFLRLRTPPEPPQGRPAPPRSQEPVDSPWSSSPSFSQSLCPELCLSSGEQEPLRSLLQQLEPGARGPSCLSRPARMLLSAARSRALRSRPSVSTPGGDPELLAEDPRVPAVSGSLQDVPTAPPRAHQRPGGGQRAPGIVGRSVVATSRMSRAGGRARARTHHKEQARSRDSRGDRSQGKMGICPICSDRFLLDLLPTHASGCGEEDSAVAEPSSLAWVSCPICALPFSPTEVERHASSCGEPPGAPST